MPSGKRHYRITLADALSAHDVALLFGGRDGILDLGRIEAAIVRPYTGYYLPIAQKAAALVQSITNNHGFVDGNKRTAFLLLGMLLYRSGYQLAADDDDMGSETEEMIVDTADGRLSFDELVAWFKYYIRRMP